MSTQNEQYQQALANFRATNIPLNSGIVSIKSCCSRIAPIPEVRLGIGDESSYQIRNSQSGNTVGTFYAYGCGNTFGQGTYCVQPALGYTAADNSSYLSLRVKRQYKNSRLRFINDPNPWSGTADSTTDFNYFNSAKFTARANLEYFNFTKWRQNFAFFGFYSGSHAGDPILYNLETGLIFRPNEQGNWRCSWWSFTDSISSNGGDYDDSEQAFFDTTVPTTEVHDFKIILENNNTACTWYIDDSPVFNVDITSGISEDATRLLYSAARDENSKTNAYAGCEVRQRTTTGLEESNQDFRINLYNSEFSVIY